MQVFRDISYISGRRYLLPGLIMLAALTVSPSPSLLAQQHALGANPESTQSPVQSAHTPPSATPCNFHPIDDKELPQFFRSVKSANLAIIFQPDLRKALECHGHEKECAEGETKEAGTAIPPGAEERNIQALITIFKERNSGFPQELYPESLTNLFRPMVKQLFAPVLPRDSSCAIPEPTMIDPDSSKAAYASTSGSPAVVNLMIQVTLVIKTKPHIVILTLNRWRKGDAIYFHSLPYSTAFPLDEPKADFKKQFAEFVAVAKESFTPDSAPEE